MRLVFQRLLGLLRLWDLRNFTEFLLFQIGALGRSDL